jgi:hypothetical protein
MRENAPNPPSHFTTSCSGKSILNFLSCSFLFRWYSQGCATPFWVAVCIPWRSTNVVLPLVTRTLSSLLLLGRARITSHAYQLFIWRISYKKYLECDVVANNGFGGVEVKDCNVCISSSIEYPIILNGLGRQYVFEFCGC